MLTVLLTVTPSAVRSVTLTATVSPSSGVRRMAYCGTVALPVAAPVVV